MKQEFQGIVDHYNDSGGAGTLSDKTKEAFLNWTEQETQDISKYSGGYLTDLEESFHFFSMKYWRKTKTYSFEGYKARRALAALDWNENARNFQAKTGTCQKSQKTFQFKKNIMASFHAFFLKKDTLGQASAFQRTPLNIEANR